MYKIIRISSNETKCIDDCKTKEELQDSLQSLLLLTAHLGYATRMKPDGFDVISQGDYPIVVQHYKVEEYGE
jgi:hypothetical protein